MLQEEKSKSISATIFGWIKKKEKKKIKSDYKSDRPSTSGPVVSIKSIETIYLEDSQKMSNVTRDTSLNIPQIRRRSNRMSDLINSVMRIKPTLLEGIPDEVIEPTVFISPLAPTDEGLWGDEHTDLMDYSHSKSIFPQDIGEILQQGFRNDFLALSEDRCFQTKPTKKDLEKATITDYGNDTALEFLIRVGFTVEEAVTRSRNISFAGCLKAAITEASIWSHSITRVQADLLILLSYKAIPKIMRYFLQLAEAIVNRRIKTVVKLDGLIHMLVLVEDGDILLSDIFGEAKTDDEAEKLMEKQKREKTYLTLNRKVLSELKKTGTDTKPLRTEKLLQYITSEFVYKPTVDTHLNLFAHYIGHNIITTSSQVEAAIIYLSEMEKGSINFFEFEQFCGLRAAIVSPSCWPWPPLVLRTEDIGREMKEIDDILEINDIICSVN